MNELIEELLKRATTPLVPEAAVKPVQDAIDSPALDRGVGNARVRGFAAGALDGVRGMTSPVSLLSAAAGLRGLGQGAKAAVPAARHGAEEAAEVARLIRDMQRRLKHVPTGGQQ